ncbi:MAG: DUF6531 domain-containing protein, partial [Holophagales bacterium]|nr:DUF6531 domain-containing protein [Holophagales bacterium]
MPGAPDGTEYPGLVQVEMHLPGGLADVAGQLRVDLVAEGPGGLEIVAPGDAGVLTGLPPTSFRGADGLVLHRQSSDPRHEGYRIFLSDPVIVLADLKASHHYPMTQAEKDAVGWAGEPLCARCDLVAEGVYPAGGVLASQEYRELLSGHRLGVRLPAALESSIAAVYGPGLAAEAEARVASVPWDVSPSLEQEPFHNPSRGHGQAAPGTLLHSGEFTHDVADLALPGVGFDFVFGRSYRNQTMGAGPLGPGWDFGYRARLRPLPDGNVDYFDGRGRRVTFLWNPGRQLFDAPPGVFLTLTRDAAGYRIKDRGGNLLRFDAYGRLRSMIDNYKVGDDSGTELTLEYDPGSRLVSVTAHGRGLALAYDGAGRLSTVTDTAGRQVSYHYDGEGRLVQVKSPPTALEEGGLEQQLVTTYAYEAAGSGTGGTALRRQLNRRDNLTSITDARGQTWLQLQWAAGADDLGHRLQGQTWGQHPLTLAFSDTPQGRQTTVTDRRGKIHLYRHNATGHPTYYRDPASHEITWTYGTHSGGKEPGLVTEIVLPGGRKLTTEYEHQSAFGSDTRLDPAARPNVRRSVSTPGPGDAPFASASCAPAVASTNGSGSEMAWKFEDYHPWTHRPAKVTGPGGAVTSQSFPGPPGVEPGREGWITLRAHDIPPQVGGGGPPQTAKLEIPEPTGRDALGRVLQQTHIRSDLQTVQTTFTYDTGGGQTLATPGSMKITGGGQTFETTLETDAVGRLIGRVEKGVENGGAVP